MASLSVVHAIPELGIGGTQKALQLLVTHLDRDLFDVSVLATKAGGDRATLLQSEGYDVFVADGATSRMRDYLSGRETDILHIHGAGCGPKVVPAARQAGVPIIVKTDNFGWTDEPEVAEHVDRYYFMSKMTLLRYLLLNHISLTGDWQTDYDVLYNPLGDSPGDDGSGARFRAENDIPHDAPLLGKIGRPAAAKWGHITVAAFERIVEQRPDALLALVTPPEQIESRLAERGLADNVVVLDRIPPDDVDAFYQAIDVLTHSSAMGETFGYVIAEAFINETPVVVNSNPMRDNAQIELVDHAETGYVANSVKAYADATVELLTDERRQTAFGECARDRTCSRYGAASITDELKREYLSLADEHGLEGGQDVSRSVADIAAFQQEYRRRLDTYYGDADRTYWVERRLWDLITGVLPAKRELVYKTCRLGLTKITEDYPVSI